MVDRDDYSVTKCPLKQYSNSIIKMKEKGEEIKPLYEYENSVIVFDDVLCSTDSKNIDQFFIRRQRNLNVFYLSQSYSHLPKRTISNISNKVILFNQTLKNMENKNRVFGGYDFSHGEVKELCGISWEDEYTYLAHDRSKNIDQGRYCICYECKNSYLECVSEIEPFK